MKTYHRILSKLLLDSWFITPVAHASMLQQLRARIESPALQIDEPPGDGSDEPQNEFSNGIALIRVSGIIGKRLDWIETMCGGYDLDTLNAALQEADEDADIHTVILWFDTFGGIYTGLPESAALIADLATRKTVISFCDTKCCSAGYWLASQASEFYCTRSACVGSIGGFVAAVDTSVEWEKIGWALELFKSGELKAVGIDGKKWETAEREYIQARVDKQCAEFRADVLKGRGAVSSETMQGQTFDGDRAIKVNLVDRNVADLQEVVDAALAAHYLAGV
jgi:signal peptide peptidase SppA